MYRDCVLLCSYCAGVLYGWLSCSPRPMASRSRAQPYILALLFRSGMENTLACAGLGHSNPATVTIETVTIVIAITVTIITLTAPTVTETTSTASSVMHTLISYALEHRRQEPRGCTGNSSRIRISGCRR